MLARRLLLPTLALLLWVSPAGQSARRAPSSAAALQRQLASIAREKASVKRKLQRVKKREKAVTVQLNVAEEKLAQARHHLGEVSYKLQVSREQLQVAKQSLAVSEARLSNHQEALSGRLEQIYQRGETGLLEILFQTSSYADFANRVYLVNQVLDQDVGLLEGYEQAQQQRADAASTAAQEEQQVAVLKQQAASSHAEAAVEKENTAALKQRISRERQLQERALAELEQNSREVESLLRRLQTTSAGRHRLSQQFRGGFIRPVPGEVRSPFGYRNHPILGGRRLHTGVDLRAGYGTPIHAAAGGLVIFAGRWGGYGNCVIIDHGGGVATLYGHCSSLAVSSGKQVKQGEVIARVGSTGLSTGPHLHFEVRRNGTPVNPGL